MRTTLGALALLTIGAAPARSIAPEKFVELNAGSYRALATNVTVRRTQADDEPPIYYLTISFPGHQPFRLTIDNHGYMNVPPTFAIGQLESKGPPVVWIESFSGGAHCCREPKLIMPRGKSINVVELGRWDGDLINWPRDEDGDGRRDLVFVDNRFLYTFTSYADSYGPPRIYNVVGGKMVEVSTKPGFRKLYIDEMKHARNNCLQGGRGGCAAYVASAARIGKEREAWAEMLQHYDRNADWQLPPKGCRKPSVNAYDCPAGQEIPAKDYPESLRAFLVRTGYLER